MNPPRPLCEKLALQARRITVTNRAGINLEGTKIFGSSLPPAQRVQAKQIGPQRVLLSDAECFEGDRLLLSHCPGRPLCCRGSQPRLAALRSANSASMVPDCPRFPPARCCKVVRIALFNFLADCHGNDLAVPAGMGAHRYGSLFRDRDSHDIDHRRRLPYRIGIELSMADIAWLARSFDDSCDIHDTPVGSLSDQPYSLHRHSVRLGQIADYSSSRLEKGVWGGTHMGVYFQPPEGRQGISIEVVVPRNLARWHARPDFEFHLMNKPHYIIRGGVEGRERLRGSSRVLHPLSVALLRRAGARTGMRCLEAGCGGGDIAILRDFAGTPGTVQSLPRIVQAWGLRSS